METPESLFERWYVRPLRQLQQLPYGDGGFVALATSCFLYERLADALKKQGRIKGKDRKPFLIDRLIIDFEVDRKTAEAFWFTMRDGLLHGAMPKKATRHEAEIKPWALRFDFPAMQVILSEGQEILVVQPWLFMEKVLGLWQDNIHLLDKVDAFPWAKVVPLAIPLREPPMLPTIT